MKWFLFLPCSLLAVGCTMLHDPPPPEREAIKTQNFTTDLKYMDCLHIPPSGRKRLACFGEAWELEHDWDEFDKVWVSENPQPLRRYRSENVPIEYHAFYDAAEETAYRAAKRVITFPGHLCHRVTYVTWATFSDALIAYCGNLKYRLRPSRKHWDVEVE